MIGIQSLSEIEGALGGTRVGGDARFTRVSTDTRSLGNGDLYLALEGENFDGNAFVQHAADRGACAAITGRCVDTDMPIVAVQDTHSALADLAAMNRNRSKAKVVALTGSQGKTTVKEMLAGIFRLQGPTCVTNKNLNNTIGVPLTLLEISEDDEFAVIEMGANAPGEIAFSVAAAAPDIALITNATDAHLEGFGGAGGIVKAKGEIIEGVRAEGTMVLNRDDPAHDDWRRRAESHGVSRVVGFSLEGLDQQSEYFASNIEDLGAQGSSFKLHCPQGEQEVKLSLLGLHNVRNALGASAVALEAGVELGAVASGLASVKSVDSRMQLKQGVNDCRVIDDSYNASESAFKAAIDVLRTLPGRRILIVGDMRELGDSTEQAHDQVGKHAVESGIEELWSVGDMAQRSSSRFSELVPTNDTDAQRIGRHFSSREEVARQAISIASPDIVFLIKASRGSALDVVVKLLTINGDC